MVSNDVGSDETLHQSGVISPYSPENYIPGFMPSEKKQTKPKMEKTKDSKK